MPCAAGPQAGDEDLSPQPCRRRQTGSWLEVDSCLLRWQEGLRPLDESRPAEGGSSPSSAGDGTGADPLPSSIRCGGGGGGLGDGCPSCCKPRRRLSQVRETLCSGRSPGSGLSRLRPLDPRAETVVLQGGSPQGSQLATPLPPSGAREQRGRSFPPPAAATHLTPKQNAVLSSGYFELISANILHRDSSFFICWVHSVMSITSFSGFRIFDLKVYYWDS